MRIRPIADRQQQSKVDFGKSLAHGSTNEAVQLACDALRDHHRGSPIPLVSRWVKDQLCKRSLCRAYRFSNGVL